MSSKLEEINTKVMKGELDPGQAADRQRNLMLELIGEDWLQDPKYRPGMAVDKDGSTAYFIALGHDKALYKLRQKVNDL